MLNILFKCNVKLWLTKGSYFNPNQQFFPNPNQGVTKPNLT